MKTELLALIDDLVKSELYVTEGKFSAAKDAKRIRADIVFMLDKAEQAQAPAAVEPVAYLHDDGYWTAAKTEQGRALSDRLHFAGSPKIGVHLHPAPTTKATHAPVEVAVPDSISSLTGDAALAHEQCRAVVHLALAVAEVYSSNALIVANDARLADQIGAASAEVMEYLGDTLNSTDATTEEDEWLEPIFEAAQERWPAAAQAAPADALDAEKHDPNVDKAWAQFCAGIGDGASAPYPGMIAAFEQYYTQSFADKDWRNEASVWAAAWKKAKAEPADALDAERWRTFVGLPYEIRAEWAVNLSLVPTLTQWVDQASKDTAQAAQKNGGA